ncbi:MAG: 1-deoxy-D-xylulose-5-phosphate synthase [Clostridia bacterium]|nr:1-deoxy-D-xylulose-5-phosphate synthase [Clostridia bacterium]
MVHLCDLRDPGQLKSMTYQELELLAGEMRQEIIQTVAHRGGHLASNLGTIELTIALHRIFDTPRDKIVFDVGHQSYGHKLLTGRYERFNTLRRFGGLSGFPKRSESPYDCFETGHASTAISAALGMARARDLLNEDYKVIAFLGDGALTGGMCYEALNDAGSTKTPLIVILNDNKMSIAPNVGALSQHLTALRASKGWRDTKKVVKKGVFAIPVIGRPIGKALAYIKDTVKGIFVHEVFFDALGFHYLGPVDGHDIKSIERVLKLAKHYDEPVVVHCVTQKGHGYEKAERKPEAFHGTPPFYVESGDLRKQPTSSSYGEIAAMELAQMAQEDRRIVAITAAMPTGTGLNLFAKEHPDRCIDVGIAEPHAVTQAAGMASAGLRPYVAIYSTFLQRSYDQIIHDVCLQKLPVCLLLDRAGLAGEDGATHHGVFDIAYLRHIPGLTVLAPRDIQELRAMIRWSIGADRPCSIRYPRQSRDMSNDYPYSSFEPGKWEMLANGDDVVLLCVGSMVFAGLEARSFLKEHYNIDAAVINCSSIKPLDEAMLRSLGARPVVTLEEHVLTGGFGSSICEFCQDEMIPPPVLMLGIPDTFVQHGGREQLLKYLSLLPEQIAARIVASLKYEGEKVNG